MKWTITTTKVLTLRALRISLAKVREERSYLQGTKCFSFKIFMGKLEFYYIVTSIINHIIPFTAASKRWMIEALLLISPLNNF